MPLLSPDQQRQSTEGTQSVHMITQKFWMDLYDVLGREGCLLALLLSVDIYEA